MSKSEDFWFPLMLGPAGALFIAMPPLAIMRPEPLGLILGVTALLGLISGIGTIAIERMEKRKDNPFKVSSVVRTLMMLPMMFGIVYLIIAIAIAFIAGILSAVLNIGSGLKDIQLFNLAYILTCVFLLKVFLDARMKPGDSP
jgi:hypothetical protein